MEINGHKVEPEKYIEKWVDWALEATPATDEEVQKNVKWLYEQAGLDEPTVHVFRNYEKFLEQDFSSVGASVGASVGDSVWASVGDSVGDSVRASVWDSVRDSVWASVGDSVGASVRASVWASVGAWYWADELAFADVYVDTDVLSEEKANELEKYKEILSTQRLAVYGEGECWVLVAPEIRRNNQGQLHSDEELAVDWNGTGLYYLNGVEFEKELWEKVVSRDMPFEEILALEDIDQRTQAMRYGDVGEFLEHVNAKELDFYQKEKPDGEPVSYWLYEIPEDDSPFTETAYFAVYDCPSTDRKYMSGVEKAETVAEAMSWKFQTSEENWKRLTPMVTES